MRKLTLLFLLLYGAIGFAQQTTLKANGIDNPSHYYPHQKAKTVVLTESQQAADTDMKNLGENKPFFINKRQNKLNSGVLKTKNGAASELKNLGVNNPSFDKQYGNRSVSQKVMTPLFMAPQKLSAEDEAELNEAGAQRSSNSTSLRSVSPQNRVLSDIVPTAGSTETFTPNVGDNFFDPGGPGGANTDGEPGNYPNCGCDTQTTLAGVSEIQFLDFGVNGTFDYLKIYDGADASGTLLYDNSAGGMNNGDKTLADMIASHGSASFTAASGDFFFFFHASAVVNWLGWDVEIVAASGGGGGSFPDPYCGPLEFNSIVEPITLVDVAGISNVSDATIDGSPAHEDFISIVGDMEEGMTYPIALEGNTGGNFTNSFTVFIDWNQDGILDNASERYEIGTITNSTGTDGQQATADIVVPAGVTAGPTRLRVIKRYTASYATDSCTPGSGYGQAEDYTVEVTTDGGGGGTNFPCVTTAPSNSFENGASFTKNLGRIVANDITVAADENMLLESIDFNAFIGGVGSGVDADNVDVFIYEDDGSGAPGALLTSQTNLVPDSQTVIGDNFGFQAWSLNLDIADVSLPGQTGVATTYWIGLSLEATDGSNTFWENSTAGTIDNGQAYNDGTGFVVNSDLEGVYTFTATCESMGGGGTGGPCATTSPSNGFENGKSFTKNLGRIAANDLTVVDGEDMLLESITFTAFVGATGSGVNADNVDVFIYEDNGSGAPGALLTSQTSLVPDSQVIIGGNFGFDAWSVELDITDVNLPGQEGADTTYWIGLSLEATDGSNTFWENSTAGVIGFGEAYNDGLGGGFVVDSAVEGVYSFDGTCSAIGGGGTSDPCATTSPSNNFENGKSFTKNLGRIAANDLTVVDGEDMLLESITFTAFIGGVGSGVNADNVDVFIYEDNGSGAPGTLLTSQTSLVPDSQTVIGNNFGFDAWSIELDIADVNLPGQTGADTTYWIGLSLEATDASNTFWENSTAGVIGFGEAYNDGLGGGFVVDSAVEGVYTFAGTCSSGGGGGSTYDDCSGAIALACGDSVTGETLTATDSGGNPAPDVFYKFTGSGATQLVNISLCAATDFDTVLRVFEDCSLTNEIAMNDDSCGTRSELNFVSNGTSTYYIMVEGYASNSGNFSLDVTCSDPLSNDDCSGAIAVSCGDSISGTTDGATVDSGAPACGPTINSPGVWYTLDDNSGLPGDITFSLCNGTTFDSKISIYSGECSALVCVDGNDDACGLQSEITISSDGNTKYYVLIHSFGGATGDFTLDVTCTPTAPPNDMIVNSIDVDEIGFPYTDPAVVMPAATPENGSPAGCDLTGANGVWYNFVSVGDGQANATIVTPGGASSVTFYTAPNENSVETDLTLVPQQTNQCGPGTTASIYTLAGQAYYVFVVNTGAITDIIIDGINLGVSDNTLEGFSYYPNPSSDILNLNSIENIESVSLYNLLGQRVIDNKVNATSSKIDVSGLSTGTYLMKVTVNGQIGTYKIMKK